MFVFTRPVQTAEKLGADLESVQAICSEAPRKLKCRTRKPSKIKVLGNGLIAVTFTADFRMGIP